MDLSGVSQMTESLNSLGENWPLFENFSYLDKTHRRFKLLSPSKLLVSTKEIPDSFELLENFLQIFRDDRTYLTINASAGINSSFSMRMKSPTKI